jgi:beta-mannosidase
MKTAEVKADVPISAMKDNSEVTLLYNIFDEATGLKVVSSEIQKELPAGISNLDVQLSISNPKIWNTWDRGKPDLYLLEIQLLYSNGKVQTTKHRFGIRKVEIRRTKEETTFLLNGKEIFLRGTSYFPDVYVSRMNKDTYERDLKEMKRVGCNALRIHVHVAKPELYELCDELGLAVIQDSDLNWVHPDTEEFKDRAVKVFSDMVKCLRNHPAIICWVCMNEPDIWMLAVEMGMMKNVEPMPTSMMNETPGPQLVAALKKLDSSRPYIKGSIQQNDLESGDLHNYTGSLIGEFTHYTNADNMVEKLNTEFGFDAPACKESLMSVPEIYKKLRPLIDNGGIERIQYYQYRLLKYFIEHYRIMKYKPCSGYFQFLFTDICPQSFYGVFDWWGRPKEGLKAFEESGQPMGVFMEHKDHPVAIWVVNDLLESFPDCSVEWLASDSSGMVVINGNQKVDILEDSCLRLCDFSFEVKDGENYKVVLSIKDKNGELLTTNKYIDAFKHPVHPKGHPQNISHELGMRTFDA